MSSDFPSLRDAFRRDIWEVLSDDTWIMTSNFRHILYVVLQNCRKYKLNLSQLMWIFPQSRKSPRRRSVCSVTCWLPVHPVAGIVPDKCTSLQMEIFINNYAILISKAHRTLEIGLFINILFPSVPLLVVKDIRANYSRSIYEFPPKLRLSAILAWRLFLSTWLQINVNSSSPNCPPFCHASYEILLEIRLQFNHRAVS
jgi:hypothetical protein